MALISMKEQKINSIPTKICEIPEPKGFKRIISPTNSFAYYLQNLELNEDNTVYFFDKTPKPNQNLHYAVIKIDVGNKDLQQCADAVIRLRAEYLYAQKKYDSIYFNFLSDNKPRFYKDYAAGDYSYKKFRKYLNWVFAYANTASLKRQMKKISIDLAQIGDVFIQQGNPYGHAAIIVDIAINEKGQKAVLIAQSFMPAQSIHIVKNLENPELSPWFVLPKTGEINLPEWTFTTEDLHRF